MVYKCCIEGKNAVTVSVTILQLKYTFNDFKEGTRFVNRIREEFKKKNYQKGNKCFWVGPVLGG